MKTVKVTLKLEFETEEVDQDSLREALSMVLEERIANEDILEGAKISVTDEDEEESEPDFEDEDEE